MGFLTTITIYNDAMGSFEAHPKEFAEALFKGINEANYKHMAVSVPFLNHANYIDVQPSRHADDQTLYIHTGNSVINLNSYSAEVERMIDRNPDYVKELVKTSKRILKDIEEKLKKNPKKKD